MPKKTRLRLYTVLLLVSAVIAAPKVYGTLWDTHFSEQTASEDSDSFGDIAPLTTPVTTPQLQSTTTTTTTNANPESSTEANGSATSATSTTVKVPQTTTTTTTTTTPPPAIVYQHVGNFVPGDAGYFADALFIGDSRMVGIRDYGTIKNADYYCNVGLGINNMSKGVDGVSLDAKLSAKTYGKIYIMLGVNDVGYAYEPTITKYAQILALIRQKQPNAVIYILSNLHVTKQRSAHDRYVNNPMIDRLNTAQSAYANAADIVYLDSNALFDDAEGNLNADYTGDGTHIYAKHYKDWCDWLTAHIAAP